MKITEKQIQDKLQEVLDPELHISIIDLGLVYETQIKENNKVNVKMTLTTLGCPLFATIESEVKQKLAELGLAKDNVTVELTFDPPWSIERISEDAKALLGI